MTNLLARPESRIKRIYLASRHDDQLPSGRYILACYGCSHGLLECFSPRKRCFSNALANRVYALFLRRYGAVAIALWRSDSSSLSWPPLVRLLLRVGIAVDNLRRAVLGPAGAGSAAFDSCNYLHRLRICDLAEDNVPPVQPFGGDGGDEELGAVSVADTGSGQLGVSRMRITSEHAQKGAAAYVFGPALAMDSSPGRS